MEGQGMEGKESKGMERKGKAGEERKEERRKEWMKEVNGWDSGECNLSYVFTCIYLYG